MPSTTDDTLFGFHRLAQLYNIRLVQPLRVHSQLGTARRHTVVDGQEVRTWPAQYRPADTFRGHFEFGLKHERLHFEFFSRLFACLPAREVAAWVQNEPTGSYARRTAFLYEWFTGQRLDVPDTAPNVGYVDAIDAKRYLVAQNPERVRRWRVNNNLPGLRDFCPLVWLGLEAERDWLYDVAAGVQQLDNTYGTELLLRSAAWLTLKESRASFAIEHEADKHDRVHRFAAAIGAFSGQMQDPLLPHNLLTLQKAVLGDSALRLGIRRSPVFIGQSSLRAQVVHYIAPPEGLVDGMLDALCSFELRTRGANAVARAAAVSFAFVYLHPLADGNGRIHRFLINHLLAADKAVPAPIVIPVSATIAGSAKGRDAYDQVLGVLSRPFMQSHADGCRFGPQRTLPDGVVGDRFRVHAGSGCAARLALPRPDRACPLPQRRAAPDGGARNGTGSAGTAPARRRPGSPQESGGNARPGRRPHHSLAPAIALDCQPQAAQGTAGNFWRRRGFIGIAGADRGGCAGGVRGRWSGLKAWLQRI